MTTLNFTLIDSRGRRPLSFEVRALVNLGYVGRNQAAVRAHVEELAREGVPPPPSIPIRIPLPRSILTQDAEIEVCGPKTSGEAEVVLLRAGGKTYVGIGSDHTDRDLERSSITVSKLACPNVLGAEVWDLDEVAPAWDDLVLQSFAREGEAFAPYQRAPLGTLLSVPDLLRHAGDAEGLAVFTGTVPVLDGHFKYASAFRAELVDAGRARKLACEYRVKVLDGSGS